MGETGREITWIRTQITVARWHLDAAVAGAADSSSSHLQRAGQAYERARDALPRAVLTPEQRAAVERDLAEVRRRLESLGGPT